jgi:hypothetical protein
MAGPFLGPYCAAVDLVALADDAAEAEAYVVGLVVPQEQPDDIEEDDMSDDIEALFGDSSDDDVVMPAMTDEQVALMSSFETHAPVHGCGSRCSCGHARGARQCGEGGGTRG